MRRAQLPRRARARGGHTACASQNQSKSSGVDSEGLLCEWGVGNVFVVRPPLMPQSVFFASSAVLTFGMQLRGSKAGHPHWIVEVSICAPVFSLRLVSFLPSSSSFFSSFSSSSISFSSPFLSFQASQVQRSHYFPTRANGASPSLQASQHAFSA
jgi:hypothetical protein